MKLVRRSRVGSEVFVGAMADVSFLLVVFFMVTAAFVVARGLDLTIDHTPDDGRVYEPWEAVDVLVRADGSLLVDDRPMARAGLLPYVGAKLDQDPLKPVLLRSERTTPYGAFVAVLDELRQSPDRLGYDITNLAIPTYREQAGYGLLTR